jgi:hypothetical protein
MDNCLYLINNPTMKKLLLLLLWPMITHAQTVTIDTNKIYQVNYLNSMLPVKGIALYKAITYKPPIPPVPNYKSVQPITLNGAHDIVIKGDSINGGQVPCITLTNCYNIRITHCKLINSKVVGINIYACTNITIDSSFISNVSTGVYALDSKTIKVVYNQMLNVNGPFPKGAFTQFDNVSGPGCRVSFNHFENIMGQSYPEDAISMYKSNGIPTDPIQIIGNWIRGGGPSKTGGGIMLGDNGGSYQTAKNNILVNPGQYGMAVSGGSYMTVTGNYIYGAASPFSNVGLYYWNQSGLPSSNVTESGNLVNFTSQQWGANPSFLGPSDPAPAGWYTNVWMANIGPSILPAKIITVK